MKFHQNSPQFFISLNFNEISVNFSEISLNIFSRVVVIFLIYYFSLSVPKFDLVHAVDAILIPFKQLRASQNRL